MINFSHKPCISDGENSIIIARRLKEKAQINSNYLDFLLKKRLDTKLMPSLELKQIKDFPKLKINDIKERICLGSFQLRQSKSYLTDLINRIKAYKISEQLINQIRDLNLKTELKTMNTTILAAEIVSRHKRSRIKTIGKRNSVSKNDQKFKTVYKVFIHYQSNGNGYEAIKGRKNILLYLI
jgi:hypothetical protein